MQKNPRATAVNILQRVLIQQHSLTEVLPQYLAKHPAGQRPLIQAFCYGVIRHYYALETQLNELLQKPLKDNDDDIHFLLLLGLYQLSHMKIATHAAVTETVDVAVDLKKTWAKGLVNAVLRNALRREAELAEKISTIPEACYNHPAWLIKKIQQDWPQQWQTILTANNQHPPMWLRVNQQKISRENYLEKLSSQEIAAKPALNGSEAVLLALPQDVVQIPGFIEGEVSVQDAAAQLTVSLMDIEPKLKILDACAAPGGKLCHLLETESSLVATGLDVNDERIKKIKENLSRLNLRATLICADATAAPDWWNGDLFDRILVDAPCSSTGVIRRHPDIKMRRQPEDIALFAQQQGALLQNLWSLLKPNGFLIYATCSILKEENEEIISQFLLSHTDAAEIIIEADWGHQAKHGRQILPGENDMDGFYYAKIVKLDANIC